MENNKEIIHESEVKELIIELRGEKVFTYEDGKLALNFDPKLANWLFDEGKVTFRLLSTCDVTYINNTGKNTYGVDAAKVSKVEINGETVATEGKIWCQTTESSSSSRCYFWT